MHLPHQLPQEAESDVLELNEYQELTPEQAEAIDRIADIDQKIKSLDLISNSIGGRGENPGREEQYNLSKDIQARNKNLINEQVAGTDTTELEMELTDKKVRHAEGEAFYTDEYNDRMFNPEMAREGNRLWGKEKADLDESTLALLDTLAALGMDTEEFLKKFEGTPWSVADREVYVVQEAIGDFKRQLILARNTERLALPNELEKMAAELIKKTRATDINYGEVYSTLTRGSNDTATLVALKTTLALQNDGVLAEYPAEAKGRFFNHVAGELFDAADSNASQLKSESNIAALGSDLAELQAYEAEQMPDERLFAHELEVCEKVGEYAKQEEEYLITVLKADKALLLEEKVDTFGTLRYEADRPEEWENKTPHWPIVGYEIKSEREAIQERGNYTLGAFDQFGLWEQTMTDALAMVRMENPSTKKVNPIEAIVALRKAMDKVKLKAEVAATEKIRLDMHEQYLKNLRNKKVKIV